MILKINKKNRNEINYMNLYEKLQNPSEESKEKLLPICYPTFIENVFFQSNQNAVNQTETSYENKSIFVKYELKKL